MPEITLDPTITAQMATRFRQSLDEKGITWPPKANQTEEVTQQAIEVLSFSQLEAKGDKTGTIISNTVWWVITQSKPNGPYDADTPSDLSAKFAEYPSAEVYYTSMATDSVGQVNACIAGDCYYNDLPH